MFPDGVDFLTGGFTRPKKICDFPHTSLLHLKSGKKHYFCHPMWVGEIKIVARPRLGWNSAPTEIPQSPSKVYPGQGFSSLGVKGGQG